MDITVLVARVLERREQQGGGDTGGEDLGVGGGVRTREPSQRERVNEVGEGGV